MKRYLLLTIFAVLALFPSKAQYSLSYKFHNGVTFNYVRKDYDYRLGIKFHGIKESQYPKVDYKMVLKIWNDPDMKNLFFSNVYTFAAMPDTTTLLVHYEDMEASMRKYYGANYYGPVKLYYSLDVYKGETNADTDDKYPKVNIDGKAFRSKYHFSPKTDKREEAFSFKYWYVFPMTHNTPPTLTVSYTPFLPKIGNENGFDDFESPTSLQNFTVSVNLYRDKDRKYPVKFYLYSKQKSVGALPEVGVDKLDDNCLAPGETVFETSSIERKCQNWNRFSLARMADGFLNHVGNREALLAGKNVGDRDTIYFFTDIYNEKGECINFCEYPLLYWHVVTAMNKESACWHVWKRLPNEEVNGGIHVGRCLLRHAYFSKWKCRKCQKEKKSKKAIPYGRIYRDPNCKDKDESVSPTETENSESSFIGYEEDQEEKELAPVNGIEVKELVKKLYEVNYESGDRRYLGEHSNILWYGAPAPCPHHDMKKVSGIMSKCSKCGIVDYSDTYIDSYEILDADACEKTLTLDVNGVKLTMQRYLNETGDAMYVAETETTEGLWAAVYPNNWYQWKKDSDFPAAQLPFESVMMFVNTLNHYAEVKKWPLRFKIPNIAEWYEVYSGGNNDKRKMGWTADNSFNVLHPIKSYPKAIPDENGLYDMYGGVAEMCADWRKVTEDKAKQYEALDPRALITKNVEMSVAGMGYMDATSDMEGDEERWIDLSVGDSNVGFRLFATPLKKY